MFIRGDSAPRSNPLPFCIPFFRKKTPLSYTFYSGRWYPCLRADVSVPCLEHCISLTAVNALSFNRNQSQKQNVFHRPSQTHFHKRGCAPSLILELGSGLAHSFRIFLGSQKLSCFLTFPCPVSVPKSCVIFIVSNIESRASQVGLHEQKKDTASAKKEKVSSLRRGEQSQECAARILRRQVGD